MNLVVEINGVELLDRATRLLKGFYGSSTRYAESVVLNGYGRVALALEDNEDVGTSVFYTVNVGEVRICVIYYILVSEAHRGRGVGSALLATIEEECAADLNIATTWLGNYVAERLYSSMGYFRFTWDELRRLYGRRIMDLLLKATCGYDDDLAFIKPILDEFIDKLRRGDASAVVRLWRRACLGTWLSTKLSGT